MFSVKPVVSLWCVKRFVMKPDSRNNCLSDLTFEMSFKNKKRKRLKNSSLEGIWTDTLKLMY